MAEANRVRLAIRPEGSTDPWKILRRTGDSLTAGTETVRSEEIRSDRMRGGLKKTTTTVGGGVEVEFSSDFDDLLSAAMCSAWLADTPVAGSEQLAVGTTTKRFEVLKSFLSEDRHYLMKGMQVNSLSLNMQAGQRITGSINFMGEELDKDYDPSGDTFDAASEAIIFDSSSNLSSITVDGSPMSGLLITGMALEINNNLQSMQGVGTVYQEHHKGSADITGSLTVKASQEGLSLWDKADENTPIATSFQMGDGINTYTFAKDREFLSGDLPSGALDSILTIEMQSTAAVAVSGEVLTITKATV